VEENQEEGFGDRSTPGRPHQESNELQPVSGGMPLMHSLKLRCVNVICHTPLPSTDGNRPRRGSQRGAFYGGLLAGVCLLVFYYIEAASNIAANLHDAPVEDSDGTLERASNGPYDILARHMEEAGNQQSVTAEPFHPEVSSSDVELLRSMIATREKELRLYMDEMPEQFYPTKIRTPYSGYIEDHHHVSQAHYLYQTTLLQLLIHSL